MYMTNVKNYFDLSASFHQLAKCLSLQKTKMQVKVSKRKKHTDDCFVKEPRKKLAKNFNKHDLFSIRPIVKLILEFYADETSTALVSWLNNPDLLFLVNHASVWKTHVPMLPNNRDTWPAFFDHAAVLFKHITIPSSTYFGATDMKTYGSILGSMRSIYFMECVDVVNVSALGNVHTLNLSHCTNVVDVSALGNVHTLNLSWCTDVVDVSALGNVHALNLRGCTGVVDVSTLGNVHTLNLSWCTNVVNVSALGNVHALNLAYCTKVVDVSALGNVHTLSLWGCTNVVDVSALGNVHTLYFDK